MVMTRQQQFRKSAKEYATKYFGLSNNASSGKYFESMMNGFVMAYVDEYNKDLNEDEEPVKAGYSRKEDFINGTDLMIEDNSNIMMPRYAVLRIDPTANMGSKREMPIVTKPSSYLNVGLPNTEFEICYGIRIGNNDHSFSEPVVVMGLQSKEGFNVRKITKAEIEDAIGAFWNTEYPEHLVGSLIDSAVEVMDSVRDLNKGKINKNLEELMVNDRYVERETWRQSKYHNNYYMRRCGSYMTNDEQLELDHSGNPKWYLTDVAWQTPKARNVLLAAQRIAERDNASENVQKMFNKLIKEPLRTTGDPPMIQISSQIVRYYEEKDAQEKLERDLVEGLDNLPDFGGPKL